MVDSDELIGDIMNEEITSDTQQVWEQSSHYAAHALKTMIPFMAGMPMKSNGISIEQMTLRLRIRYLFPQLPDWAHSALLTQHWQRQTMILLANTDQRKMSRCLALLIERVTREVEQKYMAVAEDIKTLIGYPQLSTLQQLIIQRYFLDIPISLIE